MPWGIKHEKTKVGSEFELFKNHRLLGGCIILSVTFEASPMSDPVGRPALGHTECIGKELRIRLSSKLSEKEKSVTLYHEVLEAVALTVAKAPQKLSDFNEGDFENAGYEAYERFGAATPEAVNRMLRFYGFR